MPNFNDFLIIVIKPKAASRFLAVAMLFYILQKKKKELPDTVTKTTYSSRTYYQQKLHFLRIILLHGVKSMSSELLSHLLWFDTNISEVQSASLLKGFTS